MNLMFADDSQENRLISIDHSQPPDAGKCFHDVSLMMSTSRFWVSIFSVHVGVALGDLHIVWMIVSQNMVYLALYPMMFMIDTY